LKNDPLQKIFGSLDPTSKLSDADLDSLMPADQLLERLQASIENKPSSWLRKKLWRRSVVISTVAVLTLAGAATAVTLARAPARDTTRLSCFAKSSLTSNADVVSYTRQSLAECQSLMHWVKVPGSPAPKGSLCVMSNGTLAAFPPARKPHVCSTLGLLTFDGHIANLKTAAFEESTQTYFTKHTCMKLAVAREEVERLLKARGLSGWRVQVSGSKSQTACATLNIQVSAKTINIVGFVFG
jgi:hypothetical protein